MKVLISFDENYGGSDQADLGDAFWLVESAANRAAAENAWSQGSTDANSAVFRLDPDSSSDEQALNRFDDVELHHPDWTEMVFVGISLTQTLRREFSNRGLSISEANGGFVARR
jgi:hypothetical protein